MIASLDDHRPVTAETLFHMASVTKPFVATAVMQLAEEIVALDNPVVLRLHLHAAGGWATARSRSGKWRRRDADKEDYGWTGLSMMTAR